MKTTACPMDCFDGCEVIYQNGSCKPSVTHPITQGSLCKPFGYLLQEKNITNDNIDIVLEQTKAVLSQKNKKILYYKGSGNMGVLQNIPKIFFDKLGATIAQGSLCDDAGGAGIQWGRQHNTNPPIEELLSSDVIVVWGRNLTVTSKHLYKLIKDKIFVTIDPYKTQIAYKSEIFFQIPPKGDYSLIQQFNNMLNNRSFDDKVLIDLGVTKKQIENFINLLQGKKVSFLLGIGFQKYKEGGQITHEIEKFASNFNVFDGINKGVWYLSNSHYPYENRISINPKKTDIYPSIDFGNYDIVFIQGANPVVSAPNTQKVIKGLKKAFVIFFGTTLNDSAKYANIVIPAKTFLQKKDVRLCYGHDEIIHCDICQDTTKAISEYHFTHYMMEQFGFGSLLSLDEYLEPYSLPAKPKPKISFIKHNIDPILPLDISEDKFYLLTSKYENTLNSQFKSTNDVYIHPDNNYTDGEKIIIQSKYGVIETFVKNDLNVHPKGLLFYAGNKLVNYLTPDAASDMGDNAIFQDVVLKIV